MSRYGDLDTQYLDSAGNPLEFGSIAFKESDTDDDKDTFADLAETTSLLNENPLPLNADGTQPNCFFTGIAKGILFDQDGNQIRVLDPIGTTETTTVFPLHNSLTVYTFGNVVSGSDDLIYQLIVNTSTGQDPTVTPTAWSKRKFVGVFNINETYAADDIVIASDSLLYVALLAQSGNTPVGDTTNWAPATTLFQDPAPKQSAALDANDKTYNGSSYRQVADASLGTGTHTFEYVSGGDMQQLTATGDITIAFNGFPSGQVAAFIIDAINWGAHTITLPGGMLFTDGLEPNFEIAGTTRLHILSDKDAVLTMTVTNTDLS